MVDVIEDEHQRCRARCSEKARWYSIKAAGLGFPRILAADAAATPRESIILVDCRTAAERSGRTPTDSGALTQDTKRPKTQSKAQGKCQF